MRESRAGGVAGEDAARDGLTRVAGFWPAAGDAYTLAGDMNLDGQRDGADVQWFVNCLLGINGSNCACAAFNGSGVSVSDAPLFVASLLGP